MHLNEPELVPQIYAVAIRVPKLSKREMFDGAKYSLKASVPKGNVYAHFTQLIALSGLASSLGGPCGHIHPSLDLSRSDREPSMRKVTEYRERAAECRRRAEQATGDEEKKHLEELAAAWEMLAKTRQKQLENGDIEAAYS